MKKQNLRCIGLLLTSCCLFLTSGFFVRASSLNLGAAAEESAGLETTETDTPLELLAEEDGTSAAEQLNDCFGQSFTDGVRSVLDLYYSEPSRYQPQLFAFSQEIQPRAAEIVSHYEAAAQEREYGTKNGYVPGEVLVTFAPNTARTSQSRIADSFDGSISETQTSPDGVNQIAVVDLSLEYTVDQAVEQYSSLSQVIDVQPNYLYTLQDNSSLISNDVWPQWHLNKLNTEQAWNYLSAQTTSRVLVSVLDTGIERMHPDLQDNIRYDLSVDACQTNLTALTSDLQSHGTHVAGIIAATTGNGIGTAGIATGVDNSFVEVMAVKVFQYKNNKLIAETDDIIRAIRWSISSGARIINLSLGSYNYDPLFEQAVNQAHGQNIVVIGAAGNDNVITPTYPADYTNCISVIATNDYRTTSENAKASYSNYGNGKDISAPGTSIMSTVPLPYGFYTSLSGTSMAAPAVSAVSAMMLSANPELKPDEVKEILCDTATDLYRKGYDIYTGYGNINAYAAVLHAANETPISVTLSLSPSSLTLKKGLTYQLRAVKQPSYAADAITYTSSSPSAASVSKSGLVTAKSYGITTITARTASGKSASCTITVSTASPTLTVKEHSYNKLSLSWKKVTGAYGYTLYRSTSKNGTYQCIATTTKTSYTDSGLTFQKPYYYKLFAYTKSGSAHVYSPASAIKQKTPVLSAPSVSVSSPSYNKVKISWKKVSGANSYILMRSLSKNGTYRPIFSTTSATSYTDSGLSMKKTYYYKLMITRTASSAQHSKNSSVKSIRPQLSAPALNVSKSGKKAKLRWKKVNGASYYAVYRATKKNGTYQVIKRTKLSAYTDTSRSFGKTYYYKIRAVKQSFKSSYSSIRKIS